MTKGFPKIRVFLAANSPVRDVKEVKRRKGCSVEQSRKSVYRQKKDLPSHYREICQPG